MSSPATAVAYREMCRIDKYTDIYLQEIRTRRRIHKCLFSPPGARMCKRVWIRDHGKVYHARRTCIEESPKMPLLPPKYKIIQGPPKIVRSKTAPVVTAIERGPSPKREKKEARSHPVKFGIPFLSRSTEREERRDDRHTQGRDERRDERTARPFVVEAPEEYRYSRESPRPRRRTRSDSPRRGKSPIPDRRSSLDSSSHRESRRPRETSPVTERIPLRRTNRVVEVHNYETPRSRSWSRTRNAEGRPDERRVRFANDNQVDQVHPGGFNRSNDSSFEDTDYEYDIIKERPSRQHRAQERHIRKPSPWPERPEKQKAGSNSTRNVPPPRIVQDGCQRVSSSAANNSDWDQPRNIELRRPRSRGHARFRRSSLEPDSTVVCDADHWRYGGRWR